MNKPAHYVYCFACKRERLQELTLYRPAPKYRCKCGRINADKALVSATPAPARWR